MDIHNPYNSIASRIAQIANEHEGILIGGEDHWPAELAEIISNIRNTAKKKRAQADGFNAAEYPYEAEEQVQEAFAKTWLETELAKVQAETKIAGVNIDPQLVAALISQIAPITVWHSSSYGC